MEDFLLVTYNLENLFDTQNNRTADDEFTPEGSREWTQEKLDIKLNNLAMVINEIAQIGTIGVMVFQEVENADVLEQLISRFNNSEDFEYIFSDGQDYRGIDVAMVYNKNILYPDDVDFVHVYIPDDYYNGRDLVLVDFLAKDTHLLVAGVHFPSQIGDEEQTEFRRYFNGRTLRDQINSRISNNPDLNIIIAGDFNDNPNALSLTDGLEVICDNSIDNIDNLDDPLKLIDLMCLYEKDFPGTLEYSGEWYTYDHIIVNANLLTRDKINSYEDNPFIFSPDWILTADKESPLNTFNRNNEVIGFSDHLPVIGYFTMGQ